MTIATRTFASTDVGRPTYRYFYEYDDVVIDAPNWYIVFVDYLTDQEKAVIEKKLDAEDTTSKLTFGSAQEALNFLRSRMKRSDG